MNVYVDPGLRDSVSFDTQAFRDMARDAKRTEDQIAGYTASYLSREGRSMLSVTGGEYTHRNRTGRVFVASCIRLANSWELSGVPTNDPFTSMLGIDDTTPFDGKVTAILNSITIHEFGHDVNLESELPFRRARGIVQFAVAASLPALPWGLINSTERPAAGIGAMGLWIGGVVLAKLLNPSSPMRDPSERLTYLFQKRYADAQIVKFTS